MSTTVSPSQFTSPDYTKLADLSNEEIMGDMVNPAIDGDAAAPAAPEAPPLDDKALPKGFRSPDADDKANPDAKAPADPDGAFFQDEQGKWHRPDGAFASADEAADAEAALAGDTPAADAGKADAPATPETPAVHDYQPVKTQVAEFGVKVSDGTPVTEFPEMLFSFKAGGKQYTDVPLDKVVRFAQSGVYNQQREADFTQFRQERETMGRQVRELQQTVEQWAQFYERTLVDDEFRNAARAQYAQENSPEAQLRRREYEIQQERQQMDQQRVYDQAAGYINTRIGPTVEAIQTANPHVTPQEVLGQFSMLTSPMLVNGVLPPDRLYDVMAIVEHELRPWAEQVHGSREAQHAQSAEKERRKVTKAQIEEMKAKRALARATSPAGAASVPGRAAAPAGHGAAHRSGSSTNPNVDDWMENEFGIEKWRAAR